MQGLPKPMQKADGVGDAVGQPHVWSLVGWMCGFVAYFAHEVMKGQLPLSMRGLGG